MHVRLVLGVCGRHGDDGDVGGDGVVDGRVVLGDGDEGVAGVPVALDVPGELEGEGDRLAALDVEGEGDDGDLEDLVVLGVVVQLKNKNTVLL